MRRAVVAVLLLWASQASLAHSFTYRIAPDLEATASEEAVPPSAVLAACRTSAPPCLADANAAVGSIPGTRPKTFLKALTIRYKGRAFQLDTGGMFNPLLPPEGLRARFGGFCYDEFNCTFRGVFGDAGGSYAAEWRIIDGKMWRSALSDSADLFDFFKSNLKAPQYD
jgi:hypothetical protein